MCVYVSCLHRRMRTLGIHGVFYVLVSCSLSNAFPLLWLFFLFVYHLPFFLITLVILFIIIYYNFLFLIALFSCPFYLSHLIIISLALSFIKIAVTIFPNFLPKLSLIPPHILFSFLFVLPPFGQRLKKKSMEEGRGFIK